MESLVPTLTLLPTPFNARVVKVWLKSRTKMALQFELVGKPVGKFLEWWAACLGRGERLDRSMGVLL